MSHDDKFTQAREVAAQILMLSKPDQLRFAAACIEAGKVDIAKEVVRLVSEELQKI